MVWNAVTATRQPIAVIIGVPGSLQSSGRQFYVIRAHAGGTTLLTDTDNAPGTITINTDKFSTYAIAYQQETAAADTAGGNPKCSLCRICPTFLGICCFIWLAILAVVITIVVIIVFRRKNDRKQNGQQN